MGRPLRCAIRLRTQRSNLVAVNYADSDGAHTLMSQSTFRDSDVRFTPESDRLLRCREMTLCAISDQSALQQDASIQAASARRIAAKIAKLPELVRKA